MMGMAHLYLIMSLESLIMLPVPVVGQAKMVSDSESLNVMNSNQIVRANNGKW